MRLSRPQLMKHIKLFATGKDALLLFSKVQFAIDVYKASKGSGTYGRHGLLMEKRIVGGHIRQDRTQRRWETIYVPSRSVGRPRKDENRVLISLLATAFSQTTGEPIMLDRQYRNPSRFQEFARPILESVGAFDVRRIIANHMKARSQY